MSNLFFLLMDRTDGKIRSPFFKGIVTALSFSIKVNDAVDKNNNSDKSL